LSQIERANRAPVIWNKIIYQKGFGPQGIKISEITMVNLEPKVFELLNNSSYKQKAEQVAKQMENEDFREELYNSIVE